MAVSYSQIRQAIGAHMNPTDAQGRSTYQFYVMDVYPGYAIVQDEKSERGTYLRVDYTVGDKDQVTVGAQTKVKIEYVAVAESLQLMEAVAKDAEGKVFDVTLIKAGWSKNAAPLDAYYSDAVLEAAAPLYEGAKAYADHPTKTEIKDRPERSVRDLVGWYENVRAESGALKGELHLLESARTWLGPILKEKPDLVGLSHNALGRTKVGEAAGRTGRIVESIAKVVSVDVVTEAAAGGTVDKLIASTRPADPTKEDDPMDLTTLTLESLRTGRPDLVTQLLEAARQGTAGEQEIKTLRESVQSLTAENQTLKAQTATMQESVARITAKALNVERLKDSNLPAAAQGKVKALLEAAPLTLKDGALDKEAWAAKILEAINAEQDYLKQLGGSAVKDAGGTGGGGNNDAMTEAVKAANAALDEAFGIPQSKEGE